MKQLLTIISSFVFYLTVCGQSSALLVNENFTGLTIGDLGTQNSWVLEGISTDIKVENASFLSVPYYTAGGQYISIGTIMASGTYDGRDSYKNYLSNTQVSSNAGSTNTVFYFSFVVRIQTPRRNGANIDWLFALRDNQSKNLGGFYAKYSSVNTSRINFGINTKPETDSTKTTWTGQEFDVNTTYLIVLRYDVVSGSDNDKMYLWVNPSLTVEPSTATANATINSGLEDYSSSSNITAFQIFQGQYCSRTEFDGFRVAYGSNGASTSANSAAAWAALAPMGTPLPVELISFNVSDRSNHVLVQWSTAEEANSSHFEIQRSNNGIDWTVCGVVSAAGFSSIVKNYSFTDRIAVNGIIYYRLRQVDNDGAFLYTQVRVLKKVDDTQLMIHASNDRVFVHFSKQFRGLVSVNIFNLNGQVMARKVLNDPVGEFTIATTCMSNGVYVVQVTDGNALSVAKKIPRLGY